MSELIFKCPDWSAPANIRAVSTTRYGGISEAEFGSFNLAQHVGDTDRHVLNNRQLLSRELGLEAEPAWLDQVHGVEVIEAGLSKDSVPQADGAVTSLKGLACAVMTADCLPLILCNVQGTRVAAVHAGWRGLASGIVEAGVAAMGGKPEDIIAWAGPCIGPDAFEIGAEVRDELGGSDAAYERSNNPDKLLANLHLLAKERLEQAGVASFTHSRACTHSQPELYFSYRRDGQCGRMATLVWIE